MVDKINIAPRRCQVGSLPLFSQHSPCSIPVLCSNVNFSPKQKVGFTSHHLIDITSGMILIIFYFSKILRHRRGSNTRSSLYESDALPLGHCALGLTRNFIDSIVQTIVMTSALFERSNQEALLLSRVCFLWFLWDRQGAVAKW